MRLISATVAINIGLGIFNLIPLPPLDGSKIIIPLLPYNAKQWFKNNEQIFYIVFVITWVTGISGKIISPVILTSGDLLDSPEWDERHVEGEYAGTQHDARHFDIAIELVNSL